DQIQVADNGVQDVMFDLVHATINGADEILLAVDIRHPHHQHTQMIRINTPQSQCEVLATGQPPTDSVRITQRYNNAREDEKEINKYIAVFNEIEAFVAYDKV